MQVLLCVRLGLEILKNQSVFKGPVCLSQKSNKQKLLTWEAVLGSIMNLCGIKFKSHLSHGKSLKLNPNSVCPKST